MNEYYLAVGFVALSIYILQNFFRTPYWKKYGIKTVQTDSLLLRVIKGTSPMDTMKAIYNKVGDSKFVGYHEAGANIVLVKDIDLIKQIYIKDFDHFSNRRGLDLDERNWKNNVTNKQGQEWKDLRATMSPVFSTGNIRRMFPIMKRSADKLVNYITKQVEKAQGGQIDMEDAMGRYAIDSATTSGLGIDCETFKEGHSFLATEVRKLSFNVSPFWFLQYFFFTCMPKWLKKYQMPILDVKANNFFSDMIIDIIRHREKSGERLNDFIDLMLDAKKGQLKQNEEDAKMDTYEKDAQINDKIRKQVDFTNDLITANCMAFLFAGGDPAKSTSIFAAYSAALNPHVQEKLRNELQNAMEESGGELNYDICNSLPYLDNFMNETLRLYAPNQETERLCNKDYQIPGTNAVIPKGSVVKLPISMLHYDEKYFPNAEIFDPDRFSSEVKGNRSPYTFTPFGQGPRNCIARRFALVQAKLAIANLVLNFELEPSEKTPITMKFSKSLIVRPAEILHLKLTPRN